MTTLADARSLPLFRPAADPDAFHDVTAPGGYEWWYFDAEDERTDTQAVAIFLQGFIFHPGYLREHARYVRRPTRRPPPLPGDFPCVYLVVYRGGKIAHQFMTQVRPGQFRASRDEPDVSIGASTMRREADGSYVLSLRGTPWVLTAQGPKTLHGQSLEADLRFTPRVQHPPIERVFLSRRMTGADHHWIIASPLCTTSGTIRVRGSDGSDRETIDFAGAGYHDHNFGTGPIGPGLKRWIWGRVTLADRVVTFHYAVPRDAGLPPEVHLVEADAAGTREIAVGPDEAAVDWRKRTPLLLAYPKRVDLGEPLVLTSPRVVDSAPFYLRVIYDALTRGERGTALCEVAYPHRLRWPILGRMIEMSIDKSALAAGAAPGV